MNWKKYKLCVWEKNLFLFIVRIKSQLVLGGIVKMNYEGNHHVKIPLQLVFTREPKYIFASRKRSWQMKSTVYRFENLLA
jgi:hypothetical protein